MTLPAKMTAIQYNTWMSVLKHVQSALPVNASDYGLSGITMRLAASYPNDLTKFQKPSIIVQEVHTKVEKVGFGNVLGMFEDDTGIYDVYGKVYNMLFQLHVVAESNTQCSLITSMIDEMIMNGTLGLYNFVADADNPTLIGNAKVMDTNDISYLASNDNKDYNSIINVDLTVIQSIVDTTSAMVDLSKPLSWSTNITL